MIKKIGYIFLTLLSIHSAVAQQRSISGKVKDLESSLPIQGVNIRIENTGKGTSTDTLGAFSFNLDQIEGNLVFSSVGYHSRSFPIATLPKVFDVFLVSSTTDLEEFVVTPGENPAWEIIRKVRKNANRNNPLKYEAFEAKAYSKMNVHVEGASKELSDSLTSSKSLNLIIIENLGQLYMKKGQRKEIIENTVSNVPKMIPMNALMNNSVNVMGFYQPYIRFGGANYQFSDGIGQPERNYINPLKQGSFRVYDFYLKDTLVDGNDSTFVIEFKPYEGKSVDAFAGEIQISSDLYALKYVQVRQADSLQVSNLKIEQKYGKIGSHWYPTSREMSFDYPLIYKQDTAILKASFLDVMTDINDSLSVPVYFDGATSVTTIKADTISLKEFAKLRPVDLTLQEKLTYLKWELKDRPLLQKGVDLMEIPSKAMLQSAIMLGPMVLTFDQMNINYHELVRLGLGVQNKYHENPRFGLRASAGYGFADKALKYSTSASWHITKDRYNRLSVYSWQDIDPPGRTGLLGPNYSVPFPEIHSFSSKGYLVNQYKKTGAAIYFKPIKWTWFRLFAENERISGLNYQLENGEARPRTNYRIYGLMFRFARNETFIRTGLFERTVTRSFPIIQAKIRKGISLQDRTEFSGAELHVTQQLRWKRLGSTLLNISTGYTEGLVPYHYLFHKQYNSGFLGGGNNGLITGNFTSLAYNQFANIRVYHNFGKNLFRLRTTWSQPEIALGYNVTWSQLDETKSPLEVNLNDFSTGNYEASIYANNLIRFRIMGFYLGFGARYSYNHSKEFVGNKRWALRPLISVPLF